MRHSKRIIALLLCLTFVVLSLASCNKEAGEIVNGDGSDVVMSYEGLTITEKEYMYILATVKSTLVLTYQNQLYQLTGTVYDESELMSMPSGESSGKTIAEIIDEYALTVAQQLLVIEKLCNDSGITITNEEDLKAIDDYIADIQYNYGGEDRFGIELAKLGFTKEGIRRFESMHFLYSLYSDYRFGEGGIAKISEDAVKKHFEENYVAYDGCRFSFVNEEENKYFTFDFTDDEIYDCFYSDFVKVRHVLLSKFDNNGSTLSDSLIADKKLEAEKALTEIQSGVKTIYDYENSNEDLNHEYVFTKNEMVKSFETAAYEMAVGEVRLVETEYGFHLVQKMELTDEDLYGKTDKKEDVSNAETSDESGNSAEDETENEKKLSDVEKSVVEALSRKKIIEEAKDTLTKLQNGELTKYPATDKEKGYYTLEGPGFVDKNSSTDSEFAKIINDLELNTFNECDLGHKNDTYIFRKISFTGNDITESIYAKIEETLINNEYNELINSYFDKININKDVLARFDVSKVPVLADEFY